VTAVLLILLARLSAAPRTFIACDELSGVSCATSPMPLPKGRWTRLSATRVRIGEREFTYEPKSRLYFSPAYEGAAFGMVFGRDSAATRRAFKAREVRQQTPELRRAKAHYDIISGRNVHDACIELASVGDSSSIPILLAALPVRPLHPRPNSGFVCTIGHCTAALTSITGKRCGPYRDDWTACLSLP
jgi:hypothetical protein